MLSSRNLECILVLTQAPWSTQMSLVSDHETFCEQPELLVVLLVWCKTAIHSDNQ
jgi:hypothetical protein